jgi:hypothetical protein
LDASLPVGRDATLQYVDAFIRDPATPVGADVSSASFDLMMAIVMFLRVFRMKDFPELGFPSTIRNILGGGET